MTSQPSWLDRLRVGRWDGTRGRPRSANGASSFHLFWDVPPGRWTAAEATLEIVRPPTAPDLHFWALQVSFTDRGRRTGGGHLGLQWHPAHPGGTAVNWGGYGADGSELVGSESSLPSATGNPNSRDYRWEPGRPYRLRIERSPSTSSDGTSGWRGSVADGHGVVTVVRDLRAEGDVLASPMVWSEVFAPCDAPSTEVRWSELRLVDDRGVGSPVTSVTVNYQRRSGGGCVNTDSGARSGGFVQRTSTARRTPQGASLVIDG